MMERNIIFLAATDNYPAKFTATNSKNELIARGLLNSNSQVTVLNSPMGFSGPATTPLTGERYGISYHLFPKKGKTSVFRNIKAMYKLLKAKRSKTGKNIL